MFDTLQSLVTQMQPSDHSSWELRLYSRDPRFTNHQVHKVTQSYEPKNSDELELVLGDYIYIEEKEFESSADGWVHGTSWLTGVSGYLPAVLTRRTAESDAWTLHRAVSLSNNGSESKSESDSNTDGEMASNCPHGDSSKLAHEKSEEIYRDWDKYWTTVQTTKTEGILTVTQGVSIDWNSTEHQGNGDNDSKSEQRRWIFAMRHGERVDLTYGHWVQHCFDEHDKYTRKDLNLPLHLGERAGGSSAYEKDGPLTRVGRLQAALVGEALRLAGLTVARVYASAALRCVETAHALVEGLQDPSLKVKVEPGLFEYKIWHLGKGMVPFMTPVELYKHGLNVDLNYKPLVEVEINTPETLEDYYKRGEKVVHTVLKETENEGGNVIFVGHAATLDITAIAVKRLRENKTEYPPYQVHGNLLRVPYCALSAMKDKPYEVVCPPCPPSINSSSGRYDWKMLLDV